jgi:broad specificity phosphatase PhoE
VSERTTVHLLRHGEVHNPAGVLYGRLPGYRLSELGRQMAQRVADTVGDRDITHLVSSPLERAQETARPLADALGLEVVSDPRAIESTNVFEGRRFTVRGSVLGRPSAWRALWNPFRPSWGEPYKQVAARMMAAVHDARDAARGHEAVLVSHQLPIWVTRLHVEDRRFLHNPRHRQCTLCSLTSLVFDGDRLVTLRYSEPAADLIPVKDRDKTFSAGGRTPGPAPDTAEPTPPA